MISWHNKYECSNGHNFSAKEESPHVELTCIRCTEIVKPYVTIPMLASDYHKDEPVTHPAVKMTYGNGVKNSW